ncbi:hypothetical protein Holit_02195 [Hollandina sp. SP2]
MIVKLGINTLKEVNYYAHYFRILPRRFLAACLTRHQVDIRWIYWPPGGYVMTKEEMREEDQSKRVRVKINKGAAKSIREFYKSSFNNPEEFESRETSLEKPNRYIKLCKRFGSPVSDNWFTDYRPNYQKYARCAVQYYLKQIRTMVSDYEKGGLFPKGCQNIAQYWEDNYEQETSKLDLTKEIIYISKVGDRCIRVPDVGVFKYGHKSTPLVINFNGVKEQVKRLTYFLDISNYKTLDELEADSL